MPFSHKAIDTSIYLHYHRRGCVIFFNRVFFYLCAMKILDGQLVSQLTKDDLKIKVAQLNTEGKKVPHLAALLVGSSGASETYVGSKVRACNEIGFKST